MVVTEGGNSIFCNELHPWKVFASMLVTVAGMVMVTNELHKRKAPSPMLVTEDGISTFSNELHPLKALAPMLVTEGGISTFSNELHPWKVFASMLVTEDGIITRFNVSFSTFHHSIKSFVMVVVPSTTLKYLFTIVFGGKALSPMLVTLYGMVTDAKLGKSLKAPLGIFVI
jgi:hypothetical protein